MISDKDRKFVDVDFETYSECDIEHGAFAYAQHPSTEILLIAFSINDGPTISVEPDDPRLQYLFEAIKANYLISGHNILFELAIWTYVGIPKNGFPPVPDENWRDTMHLCGRAGMGPCSLADAARVLGTKAKLEEGKELIDLFSKPQKDGSRIYMHQLPSKRERFMYYNEVDVDVSQEIRHILPPLEGIEIEDMIFDLQCNLHGVPIDVETSRKIYENVLRIQSTLGDTATNLTGGIITKLTQTQRIKNWINEHTDLDVPNLQADTVTDLLQNHSHRLDDVSKQLLEMRVHAGKTSTGKYKRYIHSSDLEGIIRGMIISFGAHTGRAVSLLMNLFNLPKPSVNYADMDEFVDDLQRMTVEEIEDKYGSYLKAASTAIRGMITAPDGKIIGVADYASIEARLVFWLANSISGLKRYHQGIDQYIDMATNIYHKRYDDVNDKERWLGKQVILGAGFGLGWRGFQNSCRNYGQEVDDDTCQLAINSYRESYPEVVQMWNDIEDKALLACRTGKITYACMGRIAFKTVRLSNGHIYLMMKLPSGRKIMYPEVEIRTVTTPWGARKKAITFKKFINRKWIRESTYGGSMTENAIQGIARDLMYHGAKTAAKANWQILFTVYDEVIALHDEDKADIKEFEKLLCELPEWAAGVPLAAEGEIVKRYRKLG